MAAMVISQDHRRALLKCPPANSRPKPLGHGGLDHHGAGDVDQGELGLALAYPDDRVHGLGQFVGDRGQRSRTRTGRGRSARCDASPLSAGPYSADIAMQPSPREPTVGPPAPSVLWITWSPSRCLPAAVR